MTRFGGPPPRKELLVRCDDTGFGVVLFEFLRPGGNIAIVEGRGGTRGGILLAAGSIYSATTKETFCREQMRQKKQSSITDRLQSITYLGNTEMVGMATVMSSSFVPGTPYLGELHALPVS